jgi:hypothetical protein
MPPIFELSGSDIEFAVDNLTQEYILRPNTKFALRVAHGR